MTRALIFLCVLILGYSTRDKVIYSLPEISDKNLSGLNESEKLGVFSQIGEEFKGDYRKYVGQNKDSTRVQFALNKDQRFAIGFKFFVDNNEDW